MGCGLCKKHVCLKSGISPTSLSCCVNFHNDTKYKLGFMDRKELFGLTRKNFKKANATEIKKNHAHMSMMIVKYYSNLEGTK